MALIGYVPNVAALDGLLRARAALAPRELVHLIRGQLDQISGGSHAALLTIGGRRRVLEQSAATVAIIEALNRAFLRYTLTAVHDAAN